MLPSRVSHVACQPPVARCRGQRVVAGAHVANGRRGTLGGMASVTTRHSAPPWAVTVPAFVGHSRRYLYEAIVTEI